MLALLYTSCVQHASQNIDEARQVVIERELSLDYATHVRQAYEHYFGIKSALVAGDSLVAGEQAEALKADINQITFDMVPEEDELRFAKIQGSIEANALVLTEEPGLNVKRKAFNALSKDMYSLLVDIGGDSMVVYRQYCPMAFDDSGAFWLSDKPEVLNPYFGDAMLKCGYVEEVITVK